MKSKMTRREVAQFIRLFLEGETEGYDWDDFVTLRFRGDDVIDAIRKYMCEIHDRYPAKAHGHYCNEQGVAELIRMAEILENGDEITIDSGGVPRAVVRE